MENESAHVYTPSELNREIKLHLEAGFPRLLIEAEVSNLARPASGHLYFSLKDERAQVRCAMFRSAAMRSAVQVENGLKVLAAGRISLYEPRGEYQFIVERLQEAGEGALQRRFEELKKRLESEGLFDPARKKPLPPYPARIGLVTSRSGAALRDLLHVLGRRWPVAAIRLHPVAVQGADAPGELRRAIEAANRHGWAEVLIVGRGGGSLEDLAAFNEESVARAVHDSTIPVISAVGHETDFSICDFVADLRAPTPSAAAELATPDGAVLKERFARSERRLRLRMRDRLDTVAQGLDHLSHRLHQRHPSARLDEQARRLEILDRMLRRTARRALDDRIVRLGAAAARLQAQRPERRLADWTQRVASARQSLGRLARAGLDTQQARLSQLARTLNAVSPLETLGRGYAVLTAPDSGKVVSSIRQLKAGDPVSARLCDGRADCRVERVDTPENDAD